MALVRRAISMFLVAYSGLPVSNTGVRGWGHVCPMFWARPLPDLTINVHPHRTHQPHYQALSFFSSLSLTVTHLTTVAFGCLAPIAVYFSSAHGGGAELLGGVRVRQPTADSDTHNYHPFSRINLINQPA